MNAKCYYSDWLFGYTCTVTLMKVRRPNTCIEWFEGVHNDGKGDCDVKHLMIEDQLVEYFPRNLQVIFNGLTHLTIRKCGLKKISSLDLLTFEKLEYLQLQDNKLTSLPENLFNNLRNLREINFDGNQLESLNSRLLEPVLNSLEYVCFRNNPVIDVFFDKGDKDYSLIDALVAIALRNDDKKAPTARNSSFSPENKTECKICWDSAIETTFIPCGHCTCATCAVTIKECHICRQKIEKVQRIYCD